MAIPEDLAPAIIAGRVRVGGWRAFYESYLLVASHFRTASDFTWALSTYAHQLAREGVIYAEIYCTPHLALRRDIRLAALGDALTEAMLASRNAHGIELRIIYDLTRETDEDAAEIVRALCALPRQLFPALGISGSPTGRPFSEYKSLCAEAVSHGRGITVHAGELEGAMSVWNALQYLSPDRIGHGVRALEDFALLTELVMRGVHLELCPTSNAILGICADPFLAVQSLYRAGIQCSISADDDFFFDTAITRELQQVLERTTLTLHDLGAMQVAAIRASFADGEMKNHLFRAIYSDWILADGQIIDDGHAKFE